MTVAALAEQIATYWLRCEGEAELSASPVPGLLLLRHPVPTPMTGTLYEPVVCLILQGMKEVVLGTMSVQLGPGHAMVVSHDLPVQSRITLARTDEPYLAVILTLDVPMLRGLHEEIGPVVAEGKNARSLAVYEADDRLLDALGRYLGLADDPVEMNVLAPLILREIHFRLLVAPDGGMLRRLLRPDSHASKIARAIFHLRRDFRDPISIPDLASSCGMSPSSFHKHFRGITATTPLQYQKRLRLLEARRLLSEGDHSVSSAAYEVGYESPNQFSREYARTFGASPRSDLPHRRRAARQTHRA